MNHCTKASSTSFDFALASRLGNWGKRAIGKMGSWFTIVLSDMSQCQLKTSGKGLRHPQPGRDKGSLETSEEYI